MIADCIDRNLVLVGNVPKRVAYLKEYVEQHNLSGRVIFTGFVVLDVHVLSKSCFVILAAKLHIIICL